jgi:hypothetical protein
VAGKKQATKVRIRQGDPLLIVAAGLLGALGDADKFPQDRAGIEALIAATKTGPDGEGIGAEYEEPDALITYLRVGTRIAPAGEGHLRIRMAAFFWDRDDPDRAATDVWVLGPDGALSDPERIEDYGFAGVEEPEAVRAEREQLEQSRLEELAREPEREQREEERRTRFQVEHLIGAIAGPPGGDPMTAPVVTHVALYDTGVIVNCLVPPRTMKPTADDPWDEDEEGDQPPPIELDDGLGTRFRHESGGGGWGGEGPRRQRQGFHPAPGAKASRLTITVGPTRVEIDLGDLR